MAYNIVKHRRGTTQEWLDIDLVPEEGELVIEECLDGSRKCKIGNGVHKFSKLPYINEKTQNKILEDIDSLKQSTTTLNETTESFGKQLESVDQDLKVLFDKSATLEEALSDNIDSVTSNIQTSLSKLTSNLQTDLIDTKNVLEAKIDQKASEASEASKAIQDTMLELNEKIDVTAADLSEELSSQLADVSETFNETIETEASTRNSQILEVKQEAKILVDELEKNINPVLDQLDAKITGVASDWAIQRSSDMNQISSDIKSKAAELNATIELEVSQLNDNINTKANTLKTDYEKQIKNTQQDLQSSIDNLAEEYNQDLIELKESFDADLESTEASWLTNINLLKEELILADTALENAIAALNQQGVEVSDKILEQIEALHTKIGQLENIDVSISKDIDALNKTILDNSDSATIELDNIKQRHTADYARILAELIRVEDAQRVADAGINDMVLEHLASIYLELADLVDDDIMILRKIYSVEIRLIDNVRNLTNKINTGLDFLSNNFTNELSATEARLSEDLTTVEQSLNERLTSINNQLTTTLNNLQSTSNLKIRDTQRAINAVSENLLALDNRTTVKFNEVNNSIAKNKQEVNTAIAELDEQFTTLDSRISNTNTKLESQNKRISSIIAVSKHDTQGNAELLDIRSGYNGIDHESAGDAVRAIGNELEELRNNLPSYIPANSVDGLDYNQETNELTLMSKDIPVGDPVIIISGNGGGGGGSVSTVRVQNNLASSSFTIAKGNDAFIDFTYTSFENEVPTGDGTFTIMINNKTIEALSGNIQHDFAKRINVAEYLKNGSNTVKVTCKDQYGISRSLVYTISVIELRLTSNFDSSRIFEDSITFRYKVVGQIAKTVHILLDGEEISTKTLNASVTNSELTLNIPKQSHGTHSIVAYMTAVLEDEDISSNILTYEILCIEVDRKEALIASVFEQKTATQGDLLTIPFQVYDPSLLETDVDLIVYSQVGEVLSEYSKTTATVGRGLSYWNTRQYPTGQVTFKIKYTYSFYGDKKVVEKEHTVTISALTVDIAPDTDGLQLYLTSQGRSNTDASAIRDKWTFNSENPNEELVTTEFRNFNWDTNGWVVDNTGDVCLRLNGDARAIINFKPFSKDFKESGKTIEFEFAVRDVNSRDAIVIDCFDDTRGFQATPDTAYLQSSGTKVSCRFKDEERIRIAITVEHAASGSQFVSIYLDGILSGVQRYNSATDNFKQVNPLPITLGSSLCGIDIYNIRVYDKALPTAQILKNYIADKAEPTTKLELLTANDVLDSETGELSYQRLKKLGQIPIITFTGSMPTFKGDKKKNSVYMTFEDPAHPELNFEKVLLSEIDVQGTSSAGYVRKNWKIKLPESRRHMPGAIPAKVFCIKVDYAEATGTHNTGTANYIETLYDRNQSIIPPQLDDPKIRTTIQGFPCVIFEKANDEADPVFSSKGNFNYDKGAEAVFGFTEDYDHLGVECWEFCNNISDAVSFLGPIPDDWKDDFEPRYYPGDMFDNIEDLIEARTKAEKGDGIFTEAQQEELSTYQAECIKNFKELHDWVLSTATYKVVSGNRVSIVPVNDRAAAELEDAEKFKLETPVTYAKTTYVYDTEEYRLAKFKNEFTDHFDMHYSTMYYVFTLFALMVDQRAKNLFLTRWKNSDGKYRWYPYFYDNDTIFGINNVGALVFDYFHEDIDQISSSDVYNGQNSTLWNNFRLCFANEIESLYRTLRSDSKLTYDAIINQYVTNGSDKYSAAIYNADAEYKYISMARPDENGSFDANNLKQVRGPGEHHLRYFIANRLDYCDSKWYAGNYPSDQIVVRLYTPRTTEITDSMTEEQKAAAEAANARILESQSVVKASSKITLTPFSSMYAGVSYASGTRIQKRLNKGESFEFNAPEGVNTNDAETSIYGASMLSSLGDLSNLYCDYLDLSKAVKLVNLKIGHESPLYHNDNIKSITLGNNRLLKSLDIRNCSGLGVAGDEKTLDISGCQNIETIYAEGTNLSAVSLPIGGYIKTLHLPASINTLVIQGHQYITDFDIASYDNITTLRIEDCPTLDTKAMLESCRNKNGKYTVEYVYLKGFNWTLPNASFIQSLFPKYVDGQLVGGILGIEANGETTNNPAFLNGTCYIEELTGAEYAEIKSYFPYLKINFGKMKSNVTFNYTDASNKEYTNKIEVEGVESTLGECTVPNLVPQPAWPENDAFTYKLIGWSVNKQTSNGIKDSENDWLADNFTDARNGSSLKNIAGDRTVYPVYEAVRKSYPVRFINSTIKASSNVLQTVMTPYDSNAIYSGPEPRKQDVVSPDLYVHIGWYPKPENIKGPLDCYAQFALDDSKWYIISLNDITNCEDYNGNIFDGYTINTANNTMRITECNNYFNAAVKVPEQIDIVDNSYTVTSLGGFANHTTLELVSMPESLTEIQARAFYNCYNMFEVTLPSALQTIGMTAFQGCSKLTELFIPSSVASIGEAAFADCKNLSKIEVDENNKRYAMVENCLVDLHNKKLLQGLSTGKIPANGTITTLGQYCFSSTKITEAIIPEGITTVTNNAFSRCGALTSLSLPASLKTLDATCFAWCLSLTEVTLPEHLVNIRTYAFDSCALKEINIPASVENVLERSFGDMPSLKTVTFRKRPDGSIPFIHENAFINSGTIENPITFNLPWSAGDTPNAPWGATSATINYNYEEVVNND